MPPPRVTRRTLLGTMGAATVAAVAGCEVAQRDPAGYDTVAVPDDQPSIQAGVDAATAGDLVLVAPGTYAESVAVETPDLTIRGTDRNGVVLDGDFERSDGVDVEADGVAVENLTARHYTETGVYWDGVEGFRASYLTAYNNGAYGIYASRSRDGRFEHCYGSGHADAGFYLGRNHPFETVVTDVIAEHNALGYSGTSAGGDLTITDSLWRANGAGIVPHTLDRVDPPQRETRILDNVVLGNDNDAVPMRRHTFPAFGSGILVWGGNDNTIARNVVADHEHVGIGVVHHVVTSDGNRVRENLVRNSGVADLGLGTPAGDDNRFARNGFATALPEGLEADASEGHEAVGEVYERQIQRARAGDLPGGDWRTQPEPGPQPPLADPDREPQPARKESSVHGADDAGGE